MIYKAMTNKTVLTLAVSALISSLAVPAAMAQKSGQSARISTGTVVSAQRVELQSEAGKGAVVGGTLGLLSAGGKSSSKKARNAIIGATAGGVMSSRAQGDRSGMAYSVRTGDGSVMKVVTDQTEVRVGDCVTVEEVNNTANIRRASPAMCEQAAASTVEALQPTLQQEAGECAQAKQLLVDATTADEVDLAKMKIGVLCAN